VILAWLVSRENEVGMSVTSASRTSSTAPPTDSSRTDSRRRSTPAERVRFRRALSLLVMTLLLPGSAQLVAGRRAVGRFAIRMWLVSLVGLAFVVLLGLARHGFAFWLASSTWLLGLIRLGLCVLAVGWALLLIDAWFLGRSDELPRRPRVFLLVLNGVAVFAVAGSLLFASHLVAVQRDLILTMFGDGTASEAEEGRYNVLLVGGDAGTGRFGVRTDSMTVASIDEDTGKTILFGLPRNLTNFPFPEGSALDEEFPDGYDCDGCTLNSLATWAADHPTLFQDSETPGIDATISGVEGITGLTINYFALVDMDGFRGLVQAMGGLTLNVRDRIPIGLPVTDYIEPGVRKLNGFETLWFTRSRESADDYSRMARQKCVMNAMLQQLEPQTVLLKFRDLAEAGTELVHTNLPASELDTFAQLALDARAQGLTSVSFVPPAINTSDPDIDKIRSMIEEAIEESHGQRDETPAQGQKEKAPAGGKAGQGFSEGSGGASTGGSLGTLSDGYAANQSDDLSGAC
jgi:LCP family protein required for cell wall assembly